MMKRNLCDLSEEITGIIMIITGLGHQLDRNETDILSLEAMKSALYGVSSHLERIAADLISIDDRQIRPDEEKGTLMYDLIPITRN